MLTSLMKQDSHLESDSSWLGSSLRSSDGGESHGGVDDVGLDERKRTERKIEQIKERLSRISLAREKKNKKSSQEIEHLKKKLEQLQSKLVNLNMGIATELSPKCTVLNNIRKTGPLLREVISAPRGIAHIIKSTFGSADNIPGSITSDVSNVGHSTFYSDTQTNDRTHKFDLEDRDVALSSVKRGHKRNETLPSMVFDLDNLVTSSQSEISHNEPEVRFTTTDTMVELRNDIRELKAQNQILLEQLNKLQTQNKSEFNYFNNALHDERIKTQRLEEMLNETIELHQAEMIALKSDLSTIATRMDYQYSDRFRSIEENIESTQNKMIRMEVNVKEWTESRPQTTFSSVMLSGTNILVEFIKLVLLIVSFALDFIKPFTGTRTRAGFVILSWFALMILTHLIDFDELIRRIGGILHLVSSPSSNSTNLNSS
ncbi:Transmembrane and coiled-coil domains protein 1 [Dirofilaria immitis]|nr:Transmembrane and coiled-coil domains protein 1 [Dirofilaria immitis]